MRRPPPFIFYKRRRSVFCKKCLGPNCITAAGHQGKISERNFAPKSPVQKRFVLSPVYSTSSGFMFLRSPRRHQKLGFRPWRILVPSVQIAKHRRSVWTIDSQEHKTGTGRAAGNRTRSACTQNTCTTGILRPAFAKASAGKARLVLARSPLQ